MKIDINTILHTKDGRLIGNAIVVGREDYYWILKTDYGNKITLTSEEIDKLFYVAWEDCTIEKDGYTCEQMQEMMASDHKHRAPNFKINENNIIEAIGLAKNIIKILDNKCRKGCTNHTWIGFQNGNGTECGVDIERLIKQAKRLL